MGYPPRSRGHPVWRSAERYGPCLSLIANRQIHGITQEGNPRVERESWTHERKPGLSAGTAAMILLASRGIARKLRRAGNRSGAAVAATSAGGTRGTRWLRLGASATAEGNRMPPPPQLRIAARRWLRPTQRNELTPRAREQARVCASAPDAFLDAPSVAQVGVAARPLRRGRVGHYENAVEGTSGSLAETSGPGVWRQRSAEKPKERRGPVAF